LITADHIGRGLLASGPLSMVASSLYSGGRRSTVGGTGDVPVCSARWWDERREMPSAVPIALPKTIKPTATIPAINTISIWIATVYLIHSVAFRQAYRNGGRDATPASRTVTIKLRDHPTLVSGEANAFVRSYFPPYKKGTVTP
jgi:hypothetical protein